MEVRYTDGRFEDRGLNAGSTYYYALQACNAVGCSKLSSETGGVTESTALVETPVAPSLDGERVRDLTARFVKLEPNCRGNVLRGLSRRRA